MDDYRQMKAPLWLWGIVAALVAFSIWSYGNARAAEALALARADSLTWAQERHDSLEVERDSVRAVLALTLAKNDRDRDSLRGVAARADRRSRTRIARLAAILADTTDAAVPDTVRVIVRKAIEGLEQERNVCRTQLILCGATRLLLNRRVRADSASLAEKDGLLAEFQIQLGDALTHRRKPAGPLRWVERGLAITAIVMIVTGRE